MKLAVNGLAGLRILRDVRRRDPSALRRRIDPPAPDPAPRKRWTVGELRLNVRHENPPELVARGCPESRVPDIELVVAPVGFNYDGRGHYDLQAVAAATDGAGRAAAIKDARSKYVDDLRRNRELMAMGKMILPVCSEDLFEEGAPDALVVEALRCVEAMGAEVPGVRSRRGLTYKFDVFVASLRPLTSNLRVIGKKDFGGRIRDRPRCRRVAAHGDGRGGEVI